MYLGTDQMLWLLLCTCYAICTALTQMLPAAIACAASKPCIVARHPTSCHQLRSAVYTLQCSTCQQLCMCRGRAVLFNSITGCHQLLCTIRLPHCAELVPL